MDTSVQCLLERILVHYQFQMLKWFLLNGRKQTYTTVPLFKKGSRNKSENYRPVSLTSVICKLLQRLNKDHMVDFLVRHKLLNPPQHGFLKATSFLTTMLCFFEEIIKWLDEGSPVDIIYLDFQKTFNSATSKITT